MSRWSDATSAACHGSHTFTFGGANGALVLAQSWHAIGWS
jgi:hypothetical protein